MRKKIIPFLIVIMFFAVLVIAGCGGGNGSDDSDTSETTADFNVILTNMTLNISGDVSTYISSFIASDTNLLGTSPVTLTFPGGESVNYRQSSSSIIATDYYYGGVAVSQGTISDPFSESAQRQYGLENAYAEPINGVYTANVGTLEKEMIVSQTAYMPELSQDDISTQLGGSNLNVTSGDVITLSNQNNSNYRYFCRIYDTFDSSTTVSKYWTSTDARDISWADNSSIYNFVYSNTATPSDGQVQFRVPGGIFYRGSDNLVIVITAYDTSALDYDDTGDFSTLKWAISEVQTYMSGQ